MDSTTTITTTTTSLLSELICHLSSGGPAAAIRHCLFAGVGRKIHMGHHLPGRFLVPILCLRMTRFHAMNLETSSQKMVTCYLAFEKNALLCTGIV
ncbi:hypothetical protein C4D60_Mb06t12140 [Musa balbisiana]|uniref:Uncharacterized protein n=1 Tax=Musa balbisiana TaxID=52838 RepID=A0A4S8IMH1_MUSBA|nr:hypothetical protein C4D60_Mb06t12140 [Musa balbisiana]